MDEIQVNDVVNMSVIDPSDGERFPMEGVTVTAVAEYGITVRDKNNTQLYPWRHVWIVAKRNAV